MKIELKNQLKEAMKAKDQGKMDLIRGLLSAIQYEEIQAGVNDLDPTATLAVIKREVKKKNEEIEFAEKSGREQAVQQAKRDLQILESLLPKQLSEDELASKIKSFVSSNPGAHMGGIMKYLKENFDGQYDGKKASEITKQIIAG